MPLRFLSQGAAAAGPSHAGGKRRVREERIGLSSLPQSVLEDHLVPMLPLRDAVALGRASRAMLAAVRSGVRDLGEIRLSDAGPAMRYFPKACSLHLVYELDWVSSAQLAREAAERRNRPMVLPTDDEDFFSFFCAQLVETAAGAEGTRAREQEEEERLYAMAADLAEHAARIKELSVNAHTGVMKAVARVFEHETPRLESLSYVGGTPVPPRVLSTLRSLSLRCVELREGSYDMDMLCALQEAPRLEELILEINVKNKNGDDDSLNDFLGFNDSDSEEDEEIPPCIPDSLESLELTLCTGAEGVADYVTTLSQMMEGSHARLRRLCFGYEASIGPSPALLADVLRRFSETLTVGETPEFLRPRGVIQPTDPIRCVAGSDPPGVLRRHRRAG
jgi:hypothetical protein